MNILSCLMLSWFIYKIVIMSKLSLDFTAGVFSIRGLATLWSYNDATHGASSLTHRSSAQNRRSVLPGWVILVALYPAYTSHL